MDGWEGNTKIGKLPSQLVGCPQSSGTLTAPSSAVCKVLCEVREPLGGEVAKSSSGEQVRGCLIGRRCASRALLQTRGGEERSGRGNSTHYGTEGALGRVVTWGGDAASKVGRGRASKGLECREEQGSQGGVIRKERRDCSLETCRMLKSRDSGLWQPEFKSQLYYQQSL